MAAGLNLGEQIVRRAAASRRARLLGRAAGSTFPEGTAPHACRVPWCAL
ncbi:hypothetical protein [Streptomyces sp. NPDC001135]